MDRYVLSGPSETEEVLVLPDSALPVEVNRGEGGRLRSRLQLVYDSHPAVGFVRKSLRSEQVLVVANGDGTRLVTDVEMANLTVDGGTR